MKYWEREIFKNLKYNEAERAIRNTTPTHYITRPEWEGVHFYNKYGDYCILLKSGEVVVEPEEIYDTDKQDWMVVSITEQAVEILQAYDLL